MKNFEFASVSSLDEAVSLLSAHGPRAKILAGGTDLLVQLRETNQDADLVLDVKKIPEVMAVEWTADGGLRFGSAVPCYVLYGDEKISAAYPELIDAAQIIGGWQIQARASVGGNLCNSSPAADSIPALMARQAVCHIAGPQGSRQVPVDEFCTAPGKNVLERGEMLVSVELPPPGEKSGGRYQRFIPRNEMDIAVVGVGAVVHLDAKGETIQDARVALGAVAPKPILAEEANAFLPGKPANEETLKEAGELAKKSATPISDMRGPAEYRTHLVGVLTRRVLAAAIGRARGEEVAPAH